MFPPGDPCGNYTELDGRGQHFSVSVVEEDYKTDREIEEGWYRYIYNGKPAIITQEIIKVLDYSYKYSYSMTTV